MKYLFTFFGLFIILTTLVAISPRVALADPPATPTPVSQFEGIRNPVVGELGGNSKQSKADAEEGILFLRQFVSLWRNAINVGAILLIVYYLWGGIEWITAGGDSGKLEKARNRLMQATIGMAILAFSFIIIGFISYGLFGESFDLLKLQFLAPNSAP